MPVPDEKAPPERKKRAAMSPEAREKVAKRAAVRRMLQKLESSSDADELMSRIEELRGDGAAPQKEAQGPPVREVEGQALEPGQRPGWPAPSVVAAYYPVAVDLWRAVGSELEGTAFDISAHEVEVIDPDGRRVTRVVDHVETLAAGTAPLMAKRIPDAVTTPEAGFALALASVFLPPLMRAVGRWVGRILDRSGQALPTDEAGAEQAAA